MRCCAAGTWSRARCRLDSGGYAGYLCAILAERRWAPGTVPNHLRWHVFFDEATISVRSGNGGNGCLSFRREKYVPYGGPDGGNGGRGGSVYVRGNARLNTLIAFARSKRFAAEPGGAGQGSHKQGADGEDLYIDVPLGTVVASVGEGGKLGELLQHGQLLEVARGGRGGRGNAVFKSSTRQTPKFAEHGEPGEERTLRLELRLIADVGLLGKPNAGKSSLLARISAARPKIADYPFTTLEPNLGVVEIDGRALVVADIPGLIEGSHTGAGLGIKFLRHVERTRLLVHLLDAASADPLGDYAAINRELELHSARLAAKPQVVALNKLDLTGARELFAQIRATLGEQGIAVYAISAVSGEGVTELLRAVADRLAELPVEEEPAEALEPLPVERESRDYRVVREEEGVYRVEGEEIVRLAAMTDWSSQEAMERFERIMVARGISAALENAGVQLGDIVKLGPIELEWR
ncbi:MAG: GTPase ObgE [Chloroflexi bacterium]|nr:GTPase ObgE [Chloroflexota bacterium]